MKAQRWLSVMAMLAFSPVLFAACGPPEPPKALPPPPLPPTVEPPQTAAVLAIPPAVPTGAPTASASAGPINPPAPAACPAGMAMVPGGSYQWGVKHEETKVESFCMDLTETTADQYAACVKAGKCTEDFIKCAPQQTYGQPGKGNYPVVCVDIKQAMSYCAAQNKRLATEEEWEWAARGEDKGYAYPWGNEKPGKDSACWTGGGAKTGPCEVGAYKAGDNPQGIHDLAGNVFEWTTSRNDATSPNRDGRGGSWKDGTPEALKANRPGAFAPTYRCGFLGIRCVQPAPSATK